MEYKELDRTQTYGNAVRGELAIVRYKDNGHLDDIAFEVESRESLDSVVDERADELRKQYMDFAVGKVMKKKGNGDTYDCFGHAKWIEAFFMRFLGGAWTYDILPTLEDCKRYEEKEGLGDCLPFRRIKPFIKEIGDNEREEVLAKCGIAGCRIDSCRYRLRRDAATDTMYLLREDFAVMCTRRKREEIVKGEKAETTETAAATPATGVREQLELF